MLSGFYGLPITLWYPALAVGLYIIMITLVPKDRLKQLFPYGIVLGLVVSWLFQELAQALRLYEYLGMGSFKLVASPVWTDIGWTAAIVVFLHFLPAERDLLYWAYIGGFALMSAMLCRLLVQMELLRYIFWSTTARFFLSFLWFWLAAVYYNKREAAKA